MGQNITLIEDITDEEMRKLYYKCEHEQLKNLIINSDAYNSHTNFGKYYTTVLLCTDEFLQSVDIIRDKHPYKKRSFDDYFSSSSKENEKDKSCITSVVMYPYVKRPEMSKKTGRNYVKEMNTCLKYIKNYINKKD